MRYILVTLFIPINMFIADAQVYIKPTFGYSYGSVLNNPKDTFEVEATIHKRQLLDLGHGDTLNSFRSNNIPVKSGITAETCLGYTFFKKFDIEIGISYYRGNDIKYIFDRKGGKEQYFQVTNIYNIHLFFINPSFSYRLSFLNKFEGVTSVGVSSGICELNLYNYPYNNEYLYSKKYYGSFLKGFNLDLGCIYNISKKLSLFGDINYNMFWFTPKYGRFEYTDNNYKITQIFKCVDEPANFISSYDELKTRYDFNYLLFKIGLKYSISKKKFTKTQKDTTTVVSEDASLNSKIGIEVVSGIGVNKIISNGRPRSKVYSYTYIPININVLYRFNRYKIGMGSNSLIHWIKIYEEYDKTEMVAFHAVYLHSEYDINKNSRYAFAPYIRIGAFDILKDASQQYIKIYTEAGLNNQKRFSNFDILIKPSFIFMFVSKADMFFYSEVICFAYGLNIGIRYWL